MSDTAVSVDVSDLVLQASVGGTVEGIVASTGGTGALFDISTLVGYLASVGNVADGNIVGTGSLLNFDIGLLVDVGSERQPAPPGESLPVSSGGPGALMQFVGRFPLPGDTATKIDFGVDTLRAKKQKIFTVT